MTLNEWLNTVAAELGLDPDELAWDDRHVVLDLARDAAHGVQRPAAPLTTFLVGVAVGRGQPLGAAAARATDLLARLADDAPETGAETQNENEDSDRS